MLLSLMGSDFPFMEYPNTEYEPNFAESVTVRVTIYFYQHEIRAKLRRSSCYTDHVGID